ncbi:MAG TPA: phage tail sheath family protein, partial [Burkholderiales bacterium]|nr:phage tail sheath family protein [Burkholderiales bacterium]
PGHYYIDVLANSDLIAVDTSVAPAATDPLTFPRPDDGLRIVLKGGGDGTAVPTAADFRGTGTTAADATGLKALEIVDEISIIAAPGVTTQAVQESLINQCERLKDRFAVLDPAPASANAAPSLNDIQTQRGLFDSYYGALYYPRIVVEEPASGIPIPMSPSGHVVGVYARTDQERGVHKAPANETLRGILGVEVRLNREAQDILNPKGINVLRDFTAEQRGYRVWGARCVTSDAIWKYISVRRLFIFIEESLQEGTQWVVFEPNDEPLWAKVRQTVSDFLRRVWRDGALAGETPEQAFFVKCDHTTMTQNDIDNGRLIMIVGIAPVKPAEFVIIRIGQWAGGSSAEVL